MTPDNVVKPCAWGLKLLDDNAIKKLLSDGPATMMFNINGIMDCIGIGTETNEFEIAKAFNNYVEM